MPNVKLTSCLALLVAVITQAFAVNAEPSVVFRDHMVLQRDKPCAIFGTAPNGHTVEVSFAGQSKQTIVVNDQWKLHLDAMPANAEGQSLLIRFLDNGKVVSEFTAADVLVGDVYVAGGQSNMNLLYGYYLNKGLVDPVVANPLIRGYKFPDLTEYGKQPDKWPSQWIVFGDRDTFTMSAAAYCFATQLQPEVGVPIGIIHSAVGATPIEGWMSEAALASDPDMARVLKRKHSDDVDDKKEPTILYDQMIKPFTPFSLRGFIWYQGESNSGSSPDVGAIAYRKLFPALIRQWRADFDAAEVPFFFVQLASFGGFKEGDATHGNQDNWAFLREAQYLTLGVDHTGMVCGLDLGERHEIHPASKPEVGRRFALLARKYIYGETDLVAMGPIYTGCEVKPDRIVLHFDHVGGGLAVRDGGELVGFEIADASRVYVSATARIVGDTVEVSGVENPVYARYAWKNWPEYDGTMANLVNQEGLPASSFRSHVIVNQPIPQELVFKASGGFSGEQGQGGWYYQAVNGDAFIDLELSEDGKAWQLAGQHIRLFPQACHPGSENPVARVWEAPAAGTIWISGEVSKRGMENGDGIDASIRHNDTVLWQAHVAPGAAASPTGVSNLTVAAGDRIYFVADKGASASSDFTNWDPLIEMVSTAE